MGETQPPTYSLVIINRSSALLTFPLFLMGGWRREDFGHLTDEDAASFLSFSFFACFGLPTFP